MKELLIEGSASCGKTLRNELLAMKKAKEGKKVLMTIATTRYCKECGAELPKYNYFNGDGTSFVVCPKCNKRYVYRRFNLYD